jgi:glyoxylase-like metal-dependent hydrolase (beta-lactamase superfamily II)
MMSPPGMNAMQNVFQASGGKGMPKRTFKDSMTLMSGADRIELHYFGRGHTNGDAWVVFPALHVMHAGDMFPGKTPPLLDTNNGGSGVEFPKTVSNAVSTVKGVDTILTGHDGVMTWADLQEWAAFNKDFLDWTEAQMKAGKSIDDAAAAYQLPSKYAGYTAQPARVKANVTAIYGELKK